MDTPAELSNVALARIGDRDFIDSLEENTPSARVCARLFPVARDTVLAAAPWPFATRRATLAEVAGETRSGWGYVYALPSDALVVRGIYNASNLGPLATAAARTSYQLEGSTTGRVLLSDQGEAEILYTARLEDLTKIPILVRDAIAWRLAAELSLALSVKPQVSAMFSQQYRQALASAIATEMRQGQDAVPAESEFITVR